DVAVAIERRDDERIAGRREQERECRVDQLWLVRHLWVTLRRSVHLLLEHPFVGRADRVLGAPEHLGAGALGLPKCELGHRAADASWTTRFFVALRFSSERSKRGNSSSTPITSGSSTRRLSSRSSWPVWSPSRTTIVCSSRIGGQCRQRLSGTRDDGMPWTRRGRKGAFR